MTRRLAFLTISAVAATAACFAGPASADPTNRTTITFTCDRNTAHATAHVELLDASGAVLAARDVTCDPSAGPRSDRQVVVTTAPVVEAAIGQYEITTTAGTTPCAGDGTLTFKLACTDGTGGGAAVVVR